MSTFQQRKQQIISRLSLPDHEYADASPKGSVDAGIRALVDEINTQNDYVTTSSCAGRVAVYADGATLISPSEAGRLSNGHATPLSTGSKGGGRWIFVSHEPIPNEMSHNDGDLLQTLKLAVDNVHEVEYQPGDRFVRLKFEPMILHILCSSLASAKHVLRAAMAAGFRESGISSISNELDLVQTAVRTSGLVFDSVIAVLQPDEACRLVVSPAYIRMLLDVATSRFTINQDRIRRFRAALFGIGEQSKIADPEWELPEARRARKRAEGLQRRQQLEYECQAFTQTQQETDPEVAVLFAEANGQGRA